MWKQGGVVHWNREASTSNKLYQVQNREGSSPLSRFVDWGEDRWVSFVIFFVKFCLIGCVPAASKGGSVRASPGSHVDCE